MLRSDGERRETWFAVVGMHVFEAAPGWLGEDQGERVAEHSHAAGEQQRAAQAQGVLEQREQEDADEGAELADAG